MYKAFGIKSANDCGWSSKGFHITPWNEQLSNSSHMGKNKITDILQLKIKSKCLSRMTKHLH